jgi:hypothetical protein
MLLRNSGPYGILLMTMCVLTYFSRHSWRVTYYYVLKKAQYDVDNPACSSNSVEVTFSVLCSWLKLVILRVILIKLKVTSQLNKGSYWSLPHNSANPYPSQLPLMFTPREAITHLIVQAVNFLTEYRKEIFHDKERRRGIRVVKASAEVITFYHLHLFHTVSNPLMTQPGRYKRAYVGCATCMYALLS